MGLTGAALRSGIQCELESGYSVGLFPRLVYRRLPPLVLKFGRDFQMVLNALDHPNVEAVLRGAGRE